MNHQFIEDNVIILSKQTIDSFLTTDYTGDLIALYVFYYYTAKWQKTNCIKATRSYVIKAFDWGKGRFARTHRKLIDLDLIEPFTRKDKAGRIQGHYVKVKYLWKEETLIEIAEKPEASKQDSGKPDEKPTSPKNHPVDCSTGGKQGHKCFKCNNRNACSVYKEMLMSEAVRLSEFLLQKILDRKPDYKKPNIEQWAVHINRMIRLDKRKPETIQKVIGWCQQNDFWQNNILSTLKLRKHFDNLELKMNKDKGKAKPKTKKPCKICGKPIERSRYDGTWVCSAKCYDELGRMQR